MTRRPIRVLEAFRRPRATTNPYLVQLARALEAAPEVELEYFSYPAAIWGRYDVFHVHWPEQLTGGHRLSGRVVRRALTVLLLLRVQLTRRAIVRTRHNLHRPDGIGRFDAAMLSWGDRLTTLDIVLNEHTPDRGIAQAVIPHGDYRDWFAGYPAAAAEPGTIGYVGLIRRYKGVESLIAAFRALDDPSARLVVAGSPSNDELTATLTELAAGDDRIDLRFAFLDDAELVERITRAEVVVLPYRHMHNSGTVLAALSLGRPVLVPDNDVNRSLRDEVGPQWIHLFSGELTAETLSDALRSIRSAPPEQTPDLARREWSAAGPAHVAAFGRALLLRGTR